MPCSAWPEGGGMSGACECWWVIRLKPPLAGDEYIQFSLFFLPLSLPVPVIASHVSYWLLLLFLIISQLILFFLGADVLSRGQLFATPWTIAQQAPLLMEFSRQEYWSGLPFPAPGDLPHPGIEPLSLASPALVVDSLPAEPEGKEKAKPLSLV